MIINNGEYIIGVDIGGTNIKIGLLDYENNFIANLSIPTNRGFEWQSIIKNLVDSIHYMLLKYNISLENCVFLGIGVPGLIDKKQGIVLYSPNLNWREVSIVKEINRYINIPVIIDNDANCAVLGEYVNGAALGIDNVVLITLGTGVGSGILISGKIFEGGGPGGAELGHTTLIYNGVKCSCGRDGCAEQYVSANALIYQCKQAMEGNNIDNKEKVIMSELVKVKGHMDAKIPFDAFNRGDVLGTKIIEQYIDYLGAFIVNIINSFRPDVILLSGGICNQGETLTNPLNEYVRRYSYGKNFAKIPEVRRSTLSNNAGVVGASSLHYFL